MDMRDCAPAPLLMMPTRPLSTRLRTALLMRSGSTSTSENDHHLRAGPLDCRGYWSPCQTSTASFSPWSWTISDASSNSRRAMAIASSRVSAFLVTRGRRWLLVNDAFHDPVAALASPRLDEKGIRSDRYPAYLRKPTLPVCV
jgi:hypothetical protein